MQRKLPPDDAPGEWTAEGYHGTDRILWCGGKYILYTLLTPATLPTEPALPPLCSLVIPHQSAKIRDFINQIVTPLRSMLCRTRSTTLWTGWWKATTICSIYAAPLMVAPYQLAATCSWRATWSWKTARGRYVVSDGSEWLLETNGCHNVWVFTSSFQMDVHCFLLTDILLICKAIAKKGHGTLKVQFNFSFSSSCLLKRVRRLIAMLKNWIFG